MSANKPPAGMNHVLGRLLASFSSSAYRWLWTSSLLGTMRLIAVFVARGWLVLVLTDSPFWVGAAPALRGLMQITLGAFSGVLLDRFNRRRLLLIAELGTTLAALAVGILVATGRIQLWHILAASCVEGCFMSVRWPALNTMILETAGPERILNASATQMLGFNLGNIIASAVTGLLVATYGVSSGYFFATGCGFVATVGVRFVRGRFQQEAQGETMSEALRSGLRYIWERRHLRWAIFLSFMMSLFGWSHFTLMPVVARDVLGLDAAGFGFLTTAGALGAFMATLCLAALGDYPHKIWLVLLSALATATLLVIFALSRWYGLSLVLSGLVQAGLFTFEATLTALMLLVTVTAMQGRVQGVYSLVFGFTWMGGLLLGWIATLTSAPLAIALGGVTVLGITLMLWRPITRASYVAELPAGD